MTSTDKLYIVWLLGNNFEAISTRELLSIRIFVLINHKFNINNNNKQYYKHPKSNNNKEDKSCRYATPLLFAQMEGRCYCCIKLGHKYTDCRTKDKIPKYGWLINKAQQHVQSKNYDDKITSGNSLSSKKEDLVIFWEGLHCSFMQSENTKELILLDSDSTDTVFWKPKYLSNMLYLDDPLSSNKNEGLIK